jgi:cardiolipin synthase C
VGETATTLALDGCDEARSKIVMNDEPIDLFYIVSKASGPHRARERSYCLLNARRNIRLYILTLALGTGLLTGCTSLPTRNAVSTSTAFVDTADTRLGRAISPLVAAHRTESGIHPLRDGRDAFAARILLTEAAERSLDVQYYIWRGDVSGTLLLEALRAAADRGVRVRLLLDDANTSGLDPTFAALSSHPNIEVRLFNPFLHRNRRVLDYATSFSRITRRMHNKSFTIDNQVTIVGGRNVGDEYFGGPNAVSFEDLDVIAVGPVVHEVSSAFDHYWASDSSYPLDRVVPPAAPTLESEKAPVTLDVQRGATALAYSSAVRNSPFAHDLIQGTVALEWAPTRMLCDDPEKGLGRAKPEVLLAQKLRAIFSEPTSEVELVSPYFVPASWGTEFLVGLAEHGVRIRILTNSLEATDVPAAHAGYMRRRKRLLEAGIALYELRRSSAGVASAQDIGSHSRPGSSLHAKTFAVDRARVFVGSFNFDPRSAELNTEMGFVIDSPSLAQKIADTFDVDIPERAYEVVLSSTGQLVWIEHVAGKLVRRETEPGSTFWQRTKVRLLSVLPLEWLM